MTDDYIDSPRKKALKAFLKSLNLQSADLKRVNLALTHSSYAFEKGLPGDNERLEFLGDAVLGFLVSRYLYDKYPDADEGRLSKRKARIVSRSMLGRQATRLGIGNLLLLGKGEEISGGRRRSTLLGCALESLIGAFYLSAPLEDVSHFVKEKLIKPAEELLQSDIFADYKSRLQEYAQKNFQCVPEYRLISQSGPDHKKSFCIEVTIQGKPFGKGYGSRKKEAENDAARIALEYPYH